MKPLNIKHQWMIFIFVVLVVIQAEALWVRLAIMQQK
ncbi:MAG: hypothetical protein ACKJRS_01000 [Woeseiaceae bacterium]